MAIDVYGSVYAPGVTIDRPNEIGDGAEVSATISCLAPWDIDDNPEDDTMTVYASNLPVVTYGSSDVYWTIGIALLMLVIAFFAGALNINKKDAILPEKKVVLPSDRPKPVPKKQEEVQVVEDDAVQSDINLDDISFEQGTEMTDELVSEQKDLPIDEMLVEPEEEVIDIDDSSASGRLSALRREMETDSGDKESSRDELSKRLDSFLKDR